MPFILVIASLAVHSVLLPLLRGMLQDKKSQQWFWCALFFRFVFFQLFMMFSSCISQISKMLMRCERGLLTCMSLSFRRGKGGKFIDKGAPLSRGITGRRTAKMKND